MAGPNIASRPGGNETASASPPSVNHRQRIEAAIRGEQVHPLPVAFWHHFPADDGDPATFAEATIAFYRRYQVDLVKLMPTGMYAVMDYGVAARPSEDEIGTTLYVSGPIGGPADWEALPAVSPERGMLADQIAMASRVREALGPDVPTIQTIYSPLTMAAKLAGGNLDLITRTDGALMERTLARLAVDVVAFAEASLDAGVDGFFFASQLANGASLPRDVYARLGEPFDLQVLEALRSRAWPQVLHLHGQEPFFDLADRYPVDIVNWEDRETRPTLGEAARHTGRCLLGGVARGPALVTAALADVAAQVRDAIEQVDGRHLVVGAGCVVSTTTPIPNLQAIVDAVRSGD